MIICLNDLYLIQAGLVSLRGERMPMPFPSVIRRTIKWAVAEAENFEIERSEILEKHSGGKKRKNKDGTEGYDLPPTWPNTNEEWRKFVFDNKVDVPVEVQNAWKRLDFSVFENNFAENILLSVSVLDFLEEVREKLTENASVGNITDKQEANNG